MIRIHKSANIPAKLSGDGIAARNALCTCYSANPNGFKIKYHKTTNPNKLIFKSSIYGEQSVKNQLITDQHQKCCFCEGTFLEHAFGDVEHYRPKGGYQQSSSGPLGKPGYYWLAYEWNNLIFSCDVCNRKYKKNIFPLRAGALRAVEHTDPLESDNDCLLINPITEDPEQHLYFNKHVPVARTPKGTTSISVYGLNRHKLNESRMKHLADVERNILLAHIPFSDLSVNTVNQIMAELGITSVVEVQSILDTAVQFIRECAKNESKFANMVRSNFPHLPRV